MNPSLKDNVEEIESIETDKCQLSVVQCECGYHLGIDATFIDQVDGVITSCPSCGFTMIFGFKDDEEPNN